MAPTVRQSYHTDRSMRARPSGVFMCSPAAAVAAAATAATVLAAMSRLARTGRYFPGTNNSAAAADNASCY